MIGAKYQTWKRKTDRHKNSAADIAKCDHCGRRGKPANVLSSTRIDGLLRVYRARLCRFCRISGWHPEDYERAGQSPVYYQEAA